MLELLTDYDSYYVPENSKMAMQKVHSMLDDI